MEPNDSFLRTFYDACLTGDLSKVQVAIATGELTSENLNEGLKRATKKSHPELVAALFEAGASISTETARYLGCPDLHQIPSIVRLFLENGLDPNARLPRGAPILAVILNPASARVLLEAGADPNLCGPDGMPPLGHALIAIDDEDLTLLNLYIEYGATVSGDLLFCAVAPRVRQSELKTRFLLKNEPNLNVNVTSTDWGTPLHCAIAAGKPSVVKLLLEAGADRTAVAAGRKISGTTPAQTATQRVKNADTRDAILRLLSES